MLNFLNEKEMSECFINYLKRINKSSTIHLYEEYKSPFGIPDIVLLEKESLNVNFILSIELKIQNWKRALIQAYRYKSFSNLVFVIMDEKNIKNALVNQISFKHFNIGLASFNPKNELKVYFSPFIEKPFSEKYLDNLTKTLDNDSVLSYDYDHNCITPKIINRYELDEDLLYKL